MKSLVSRQQGADKTIAILPGEQSTLRYMATPPKNAAKFNAAASYMLEDELAEPLENIHYATMTSPNGGFVLAVGDEIVKNWVEVFTAAGLDVDVLTTDVSVVANAANEVILLRGKSRTVAGNATNGLACENDLFDNIGADSVSYTHLTLPTIYSV